MFGDIKYGPNKISIVWCNNALRRNEKAVFEIDKWLRFVEWIENNLGMDGSVFQEYEPEILTMRLWFQTQKQFKLFFAMLMRFAEDEEAARVSFQLT